MRTLENIYSAVNAVIGAKGDSIHNMSPATGRMIDALLEMGINVGGLD